MNLEYTELHFDGTKWDEPSLSIISDMLSVWDTDHRILICHPNCVFAQKPVSKEMPDFTEINWQDLADAFSYTNDNSFQNFLPYCDDAFKYLHRRFRHELFDNKKIQQPRHLVVLEQDKMGGNLVRGIFKATKESLMVAENPLYTKYKATSIWDKHLRLTADRSRSLAKFISENTSSEGNREN